MYTLNNSLDSHFFLTYNISQSTGIVKSSKAASLDHWVARWLFCLSKQRK